MFYLEGDQSFISISIKLTPLIFHGTPFSFYQKVSNAITSVFLDYELPNVFLHKREFSIYLRTNDAIRTHSRAVCWPSAYVWSTSGMSKSITFYVIEVDKWDGRKNTFISNRKKILRDIKYNWYSQVISIASWLQCIKYFILLFIDIYTE